MKRALLVALVVVGCTKKSDPPATATPVERAVATKPSEMKPGVPTADLAWHTVDPAAPVAVSLASFVKDARAAGLKPYAYLHASWCGPCKAIEKTHAADAQMAEAFKGTAIAMIDIDAADPKGLSAHGLESSAIPVFFKLDDAGKPTGDKIDGGAWGDNTPDNMAPPLKAFFAK
jgi:thiol-disulfide isomerase/thioredoxin